MPTIDRRAGAGLLALLLSALLTACLFLPGKFTSDLEVRKDGTFTYRYTGGIYLLPLAFPDAKATFEPSACYDVEMEEHTCPEEELAKQKREFEEQQAEKARTDAQAAQIAFGGINPSDPKAAEEIAERLRRQKGWNRVDYKGGGLFDVDFAVSGKLDHDFAFPTVERFPLTNAFVQIALRQDGSVRIDAPGFAPSSSTMASGNMMRGALTDPEEKNPMIEGVDGTFTIRTDAEILANNTDEGPQKAPKGQVLSWTVNARSSAAPAVLLRLAH